MRNYLSLTLSILLMIVLFNVEINVFAKTIISLTLIVHAIIITTSLIIKKKNN